ncbi:MAG: 4-(cytidine 5'-diphospho)-2-C-methyl-D-erythritol kinase [Clostridia bacterium]|nr:4-(cytidine 5'-diphospho)-2-C-methyl-D-erythritol kinase [Clostridia bacterium]
MKITVSAPAKINIFLDILRKLDNGYHSLFMVMQTVGLCDTVTLEKAESGIALTCSDSDIPTDEKNTAYKAAKVFFEYTNIRSGIKIDIEKNIPHEAGLAGGSADAAAVLRGMNELFETNLSSGELCSLGLKVGSDVPFCTVGGTCIVQNTGGIISQVKPLKKCFVLLVKPERGVSTAKAYADADEVYLYHPDSVKIMDCCEKGDFEGICKYAGNVFEQVVEVPERVEIKRIMRLHNVSLAQMSGSGPTVFGLFENKEDAEAAAADLGEKYGKVFITETV